MKKILIITLVLSVILTGCKKSEISRVSGSETIDNILYGSGPYYAMGFSVPLGLKVSTSNNPPDVITVMADNDVNFNVRKIYFTTNNFLNSFSLFGQYADAAAASQAFKDLISFTEPVWVELGDAVKPNQIWLYRTSTTRYAKIRIISTVGEKRDNKPYAECSFEWAYQGDGSLTFPLK